MLPFPSTTIFSTRAIVINKFPRPSYWSLTTWRMEKTRASEPGELVQPSREINAAFENVGRDRPDALFVGTNTFFTARRIQVVQLAAFHRLPAVYSARNFVEV